MELLNSPFGTSKINCMLVQPIHRLQLLGYVSQYIRCGATRLFTASLHRHYIFRWLLMSFRQPLEWMTSHILQQINGVQISSSIHQSFYKKKLDETTGAFSALTLYSRTPAFNGWALREHLWYPILIH